MKRLVDSFLMDSPPWGGRGASQNAVMVKELEDKLRLVTVFADREFAVNEVIGLS